MYCFKCGKELPNDSYFCDSCGTNIKPNEKAANTVHCIMCGKLISKEGKYCIYCGNKNANLKSNTDKTHAKRGNLFYLGVGAILTIIVLFGIVLFSTEGTEGIEVEDFYMENLVTGYYHLIPNNAKGASLVTIELNNFDNEEYTVKIESEIEGYTKRISDTIKLDNYELIEIYQTPTLIQSSVANLSEPIKANLNVKVSKIEGEKETVLYEKNHYVKIYPKRDMVWSQDGIDFTPYVIAWVTPTNPKVEMLIRSAANRLEHESMFGYQGTEEDVYDQLQAIYYTIKDDYKIRYISTPVSLYGENSQRIRLPSEVINQKSGNCIETTLLWASVIEALDMNPYLIFIPGHAFIACEKNNGSGEYFFIETTDIGPDDTFEIAIEDGTKTFEIYKDKFYSYNVRKYREDGILPMGQ
ncbi:MAG: zinc ribbon domain-containing protein [Candidatus Methanofastidiosa archaeon]|nr:zinc ribbon domain-containing protein [Candidatus Methanofastidiosa archaeon]